MKYISLKRIADIFFSSISIVILFPLILMIGILIKVNSRGPIFYLAKRSGLDGELFYIIKLRTMYFNAHTTKMTTSSNDDILTNGGRVLGAIGVSNNLKDAVDQAYALVEKISFKDKYFRTDIAQKAFRHMKA